MKTCLLYDKTFQNFLLQEGAIPEWVCPPREELNNKLFVLLELGANPRMAENMLLEMATDFDILQIFREFGVSISEFPHFKFFLNFNNK